MRGVKLSVGAGPQAAPPRLPDAGGLLNALPHPVVVVDAGDDIVFLNAAAEQFLRGSLAGLAGTNLQDLIPHDNPLLALLGKVRKSGNSMTEHGIRLNTPRMGSHLVSVDGAPMAEPPGHVIVMLQEQSIAGKIRTTAICRSDLHQIVDGQGSLPRVL